MSEKLKVETTDRELILEREFDAPRDLVFEAFSSCEHLSNWWGPRSWPMAECSMDFREGGTWHYCLRGPNEGDESWGKGFYKEISKPQRIVLEDFFSDKDGTINKDFPGSLNTYDFIDQNGKTVLRSVTEYPGKSDLEKVLEMGVVEGISETYDRLEEHLSVKK